MRLAILSLLLLSAAGVCAQANPAKEPGKPVFVPPLARLQGAKTALVRNAGGSEIPYDVITSGLEGWGRFRLVDSRSEADIIIEVSSPEDEHASFSGKTRAGSAASHPDYTSDSRDPSPDVIKLAVYDARTHLGLWSATEQPKGGLRQRTREDHLVEAAARLVRRFRERLEPPPKP